MKYKTFDFSDNFCLVFKRSDHIIWRTIQKPSIFDHKTGIFDHKTGIFACFSDHHSKFGPFGNQIIQEWNTFGPFEYQTCPIFRWLLYSQKSSFQMVNTRWRPKSHAI